MTVVNHAADDAELRQVIDSWTRNLRARNVDALCRAPPPESRANDLERWFASWPGSAEREMRWLEVASEGRASCHMLSRLGAGRWVRATVGLSKVAGEWQVTNERIWRLPGTHESAEAGADAAAAA